MLMTFKKALEVFDKNYDIWNSDPAYQPEELLKLPQIRSKVHDARMIRREIGTIQTIVNDNSLLAEFRWLMGLGWLGEKRLWYLKVDKHQKDKARCVKLRNDLLRFYRGTHMMGNLNALYSGLKYSDLPLPQQVIDFYEACKVIENTIEYDIFAASTFR